MQYPMAWAGGAMVAGAWLWPACPVGPRELLLAMVLLLVLAVCMAGSRTALWALTACAFVSGGAVCAVQPAPPNLGEHSATIGKVVGCNGRVCKVDSQAGALTLWFGDNWPGVGDTLAVWTTPMQEEIVLPGGVSRRWSMVRSRRSLRRVKRWLPLGSKATRFRSGHGRGWFTTVEHGGLLWAFVSGERDMISEHTRGLLRRTGTSHLLSISGMHVGLVAGVSLGVLGPLVRLFGVSGPPRLVRSLPVVGATICACLYASSVGWPVSTQRAVWMIVGLMACRYWGRPAVGGNLLGAAAVGVVLTDPSAVGELSFALSFSAVLGMLWTASWVTRWVPPDWPSWCLWMFGSLGATVGATLGTLPVVAFVFQELSLVAPVANLWAAPWLACMAIPSAIAAQNLPEPLALFFLCWGDAAVEIGLAGLEVLPRKMIHPAVGLWGAVGLGVALWLRKRIGLAVLVATLALALKVRTTDRLVVTFLAIGQGDAALVEWPDGRTWLVDGGPPSKRLLHWLRRRGIRELDAIFLSHPHPDHFGGLIPVLDALTVRQVWLNRPPEMEENAYLELWQTLWANEVAVAFPDDSGAELLHPLDGWKASGRHRVNEESLVLRVSYGARSFLFTGDIQSEAEGFLRDVVPPSDVLKIPHHGSRTSSSVDFLAAVRPAIALVSCGPSNRFGHPTHQVLGRLISQKVYRTDRDGTVEISTNGTDLRTRTWTPSSGWKQHAN